MRTTFTTNSGDEGIVSEGSIGLNLVRRAGALLAIALSVVTLATVSAPVASAQLVNCARTYTLDADFDEGILDKVNHDAPNNNQLQLDDRPAALPYIWIANSLRGTVSRVDVNTGAILGEYRTAPAERPTNPSRTTVDFAGNVWVGNRDEEGLIGGVRHGSVVKIALILGGTRVNSDGTPNPVGDYLAPPFAAPTAGLFPVLDRDGDGLLKTSRGQGDIRPWSDPGDLDVGDVADADDEAIMLYERLPEVRKVRHVSIDANDDIWVGGFPGGGVPAVDMVKIDGQTGAILTTLPASRGCGGYGGFVDGAGVLWSAGSTSGLMRHDPSTNVTQCLSIPLSYGMAIDNLGNVWNSTFIGNQVYKFDPAGNALMAINLPAGSNPRGLVVTPDNDLWTANSGTNTVFRYDNNGVFEASIPVGIEPTGLAVDVNGKVWVTNLVSNNAMRINPLTNLVDLTVDLGAGAGPYNYSDMTGQLALRITPQSGTWTVVVNSGAAGTTWGEVSWNGSTPVGTSIGVEVRAAASVAGLAAATYTPVVNGVPFCGSGVTGQYMQVRTTLTRAGGTSATPILFDLTVALCDDVPPVPDVAVLPNLVGNCTGVTVPTPTATDNCSGAILGQTTDPTTYNTPGNYVVDWTYTDAAGNTSQQSQNVSVSGGAPAIVVKPKGELWPPNHKYVNFTMTDMVSSVSGCGGGSGGAPSISDITITKVTSDEVEDAQGNGDGNTDNDMVIAANCKSVQLRSERQGAGNGRAYRVHLKLVDGSGNVTTASFVAMVPHSQSGPGVEGPAVYTENSNCPLIKWSPSITGTDAGYSLMPNMPNPFSSSTSIDYSLGQAGRVNLSIYDVNSNLVATLVDGDRDAGTHTAVFDASKLQSGTYIYRLQVNGTSLTRRMILVK